MSGLSSPPLPALGSGDPLVCGVEMESWSRQDSFFDLVEIHRWSSTDPVFHRVDINSYDICTNYVITKMHGRNKQITKQNYYTNYYSNYQNACVQIICLNIKRISGKQNMYSYI